MPVLDLRDGMRQCDEMKFFDTHVHFPQAGAKPSATDWILNAQEAGVKRCVAVGGSQRLNAAAEAAAGAYPAQVQLALGFDRDQASADNSGPVAALKTRLDERNVSVIKVAAVGEIGMDLHYKPESAGRQRDLFEAQLALAREYGLPVIVHCREAEQDVLECLQAHARLCPGRLSANPGVLHCFTGSAGFADKLVDAGYMISFSGILTFKNASALRETARVLPLDRLVVETDSPFLAPEPCRGRANEPALVKHVALLLADVRGCPAEDLVDKLWDNACRLFGEL